MPDQKDEEKFVPRWKEPGTPPLPRRVWPGVNIDEPKKEPVRKPDEGESNKD